jgi:tetratricopeptide (TPR) repeat protein
MVISHYRIRQHVGEGGMGEVYEAEQEKPIRRRVALKIIKWGMDTEDVVARFESERQALAMMSHPNIARVFDAGATERGRPYFAMEYVKGVPITEYCDTERVTTRERLQLFIQVCDGVQHAHQKGIIHRDIKASNVLVEIQDAKAVPKIIDFGVAKATAQRLTERTVFTELGQLIGTPEYMSPEQAEMTGLDVDTRTDVYSLGVLLYVLLVGALPFDSRELRAVGSDEIGRKIRNTDPARPSTRVSSLTGDASINAARNRRTDPPALQRQLRGDLDWIVMKAIEKDRTRRYASASDFAADIQRHLKHQPVLAGPPSTLYRAQKFVLRHKAGVTAAALVALALLIGIIGTTAGMIRARTAKAQARQEAETARQVSDFLVGLFRVADPGEARGETITAREILDKGAEKIQRELAGQPATRGRLMATIGEVYMHLGSLDRARSLLEEAYQTRLQSLGEKNDEVVDSLRTLAVLETQLGNYDEAERLAGEVLQMRRAILGERHEDVAVALQDMAVVMKLEGNYAEAESLYQEALEMKRELLGARHEGVASTLTSLAELLRATGELDEAETLHREALSINRELYGEIHPEVSITSSNLALVLQEKREYREAARLLKTHLDMDRKIYGNEHPAVAVALNNLAALMRDMGKLSEAERLHRQSLALRRKLLGADHPDLAASLNNLSLVLEVQGSLDEAEDFQRQAIALVRITLGEEHPHLAISLRNLGHILHLKKDYFAAEEALRESLNIFEKTLPDTHWRRGDTQSLLGYCRAQLGRLDEAEELLLKGYKVVRSAQGEDAPRTVDALRRVIDFYEISGRDVEAAEYRARLVDRK